MFYYAMDTAESRKRYRLLDRFVLLYFRANLFSSFLHPLFQSFKNNIAYLNEQERRRKIQTDSQKSHRHYCQPWSSGQITESSEGKTLNRSLKDRQI